MKILSCLLIFPGLFLFAGCEQSAPEATDAGLTLQSPAALVGSAIAETDEFMFCVSEEADAQSLKESADRLHGIAESLPASVSASGLGQNKKDQLSQSIEALKTACGGLASSVENQAASSELLKASSKIRSELISISKKFR